MNYDTNGLATTGERGVSKVDSRLNYDLLSTEKQQRVDKLITSLNVFKSASLLEFGKGVMTITDNHSKTLLSESKTKDVGEVGKLLTNLITEVEKMYPAGEKKDGKLMAFIKRRKKAVQDELSFLRSQYDTVEGNIQNYARQLGDHQRIMIKGLNFYDVLSGKLADAYEELGLHIIALLKIQEELNMKLPELREEAEKSDESMRKYRGAVRAVENLDRKIFAFESARTVTNQMSEQSTVIKEGDAALAEKLQTYIYQAVSAWRTAASIALGLEAQKQTTSIIRRGDEALDKLLRMNADSLHDNAIEITRMVEAGMYKPETIVYANDKLIETINDMMVEKEAAIAHRSEARSMIAESEERKMQALLEAESYIMNSAV